MARPPSEKKTTNVGWRYDAEIVAAFVKWCEENDKRPAKVIERLMAQACGFSSTASAVPAQPVSPEDPIPARVKSVEKAAQQYGALKSGTRPSRKSSNAERKRDASEPPNKDR